MSHQERLQAITMVEPTWSRCKWICRRRLYRRSRNAGTRLKSATFL
ncbi:hypothetical protein [Lysobacter gummosus]